MRIVIDMQGLQTESRYRGIGRYALSFAQAVVRNRGEHEIILLLSAYLPDTIAPIRQAFEGLLPQSHIVVWYAPESVSAIDETNTTRQQIATQLRDLFIASLEPDIVHIMSLFEGYNDDATTAIEGLAPHAAITLTFYDLIPLLNPEQYLTPNPSYARYYNQKIDSLQHVSRFFAISEFARTEGLAHLAVPAEAIVTVSSAIEAIFQPLEVDKEQAAALQQRFGLTRPFVLYTGGADERKNLPRLIQAYAELPQAVRQAHQLLFVGKLSQSGLKALQQIARSHGLQPDELCFTGYITDTELVQLYNLCKLFIFPSWHEGFGLPALEAMACGTAVLGANTSSLPEVIGLESALFDPLDVQAISTKLCSTLENESFLAELRTHGLQQSKRFSWDRVAQIALQEWQQVYLETASTPVAAPIQHEALITQLAAVLSRAPTPPTDEALRALAICLDKNEQQVQTFLRFKALPEQLTWRLEGPFDSSYSLALLNRETARALAQLGHQVQLHSTEGPGDFAPNAAFLAQNPDLAQMHRLAASNEGVEADVISRNLYPPRVSDMSGRFNLLHNYNWEESGFPAEWVVAFNQSLQGVLVASQHVKKVLIDNGVRVPLAVSGVGTDHWENLDADLSIPLKGAKAFRFLHVSSCFPRKGIDCLLAAYGQAFSAQDEVTLVIKTFANPHNEIQGWLKEAQAQQADYPHVILLEADYSDAQIKGLYAQCQALVAPSRAEGFGLPMAEAMLSGLAVITTAWSGQTDFCTPDTAWLIDYHFARAQTHFNLYGSVWAEPDTAHLSQLLREVYDMPEAARQQRVAAGQTLLAQQLRWTQVAERMVANARQWSVASNAVTPRIGWITSWNTPCGIATYSERLIAAIPSAVTVLAAHADTLTAVDEGNVARCWTQGHDSLQAIEQAIEQAKLDSLVVQFNYGFFNFEQLASFLLRQLDQGRTVVVMLHATTDPAHDPVKKLALLVPALAKCDRLLVHSPHDMNRLKAYGLVDNVALFPHGILDFTPELKPASKAHAPFVVASYGFFLPHKGLLELIEAVALLNRTNPAAPVHLQMINAEYPNPVSAEVIAEAKAQIAQHQLQGMIHVCTDYLDDEECLQRLAAVDLVVFPYQDTGESSSAAVRYGIAAGTPVAVTPLAIFEDVAGAVFTLAGQQVADIASGIAHIREQLAQQSAEAQAIAEASVAWRAQHAYSALGPRLFNMLYALKNEGV